MNVWLRGDGFGVAYLLDTMAGMAQRHTRKAQDPGRLAGLGRPIGAHFVAVYVHPEELSLVLQIDQAKFPLNGPVSAYHKVRMGGVLSRLVVEYAREPRRVVLQRWTFARAILSRVDPAYDEWDEERDDFLIEIADIVNSPERQRGFMELMDPLAKPWESGRRADSD